MSYSFAFLDSGIGGVPYMCYLKEHYPSYDCVYLADTKHFPYGTKDSKEIYSSAREAIETIQWYFNPKVLVIACNTISTSALDLLREHFKSLPIVGTVPAIKLASTVTQNNRIGLLATNATIEDKYTHDLIDHYAKGCFVKNTAAPDLVDFVEKRLFSNDIAPNAVRDIITPYIDQFRGDGCDTIVLGCTHFTHLVRAFQSMANGINIVDSRKGVSSHAIEVLNSLTPSNTQETPTQDECITDRNNTIGKFYMSAPCGEEIYSNLCDTMNIDFGGVL